MDALHAHLDMRYGYIAYYATTRNAMLKLTCSINMSKYKTQHHYLELLCTLTSPSAVPK